MRAWWLALVACSSGGSAPRDGGGGIAVVRGGAVVEEVAAPADLWRYCDGVVAAVHARGPGGFVHGDCDTRDDFRFTLDGAGVAELTRARGGALVARTVGVTTITLDEQAAAPAPSPAGVTIAIAGRAPLELDAAAFDALVPDRRRRDGVPLAALLDHAGVPSPTAITIRGDTTYSVEPRWLRDPAHRLLLRRNRRGLLRFGHLAADTERAKVARVTSIDVTP